MKKNNKYNVYYFSVFRFFDLKLFFCQGLLKQRYNYHQLI